MQNKTTWIVTGLLGIAALGAVLSTLVKREHAPSHRVHSQGGEAQNLGATEARPSEDTATSRRDSPLSLSPAFNRYAEATDYQDRTESLRANLLSSLQHIAQGLQVDDQARKNIIGLIENTLHEEKVRDELAKSLADQLTEKDLAILSELHEHPVSQKVQSREDTLMKQNSETLAKFLEQYQDEEAFKLAQDDSNKIMEDLQLWQDTEKMFQSITNQLLSGLNQDKKVVSPALFQETTTTLLASQRQAMTIGVMYLYQDLSAQELKDFKEIYKTPAANKERQIVFDYFTRIFGQIGSSMGRIASQSQSTK